MTVGSVMKSRTFRRPPQLQAEPLVIIPGVTVAGTATWSVSIPAHPAFVGGVYFEQGFVVDSAALGGGAVTNGAMVRIGGK